jgi:hypothetical protein
MNASLTERPSEALALDQTISKELATVLVQVIGHQLLFQRVLRLADYAHQQAAVHDHHRDVVLGMGGARRTGSDPYPRAVPSPRSSAAPGSLRMLFKIPRPLGISVCVEVRST